MSLKNNVKKTWFICFAAALGGLLFGFDTAVISGTLQLVKLQFDMNAVTEGWFVSSGLLGCIFGVFIAGLLSDRIGRKRVLLLAAALFLVSGVGCAWAASSDTLVIYRLIGGMGVGIASVMAPMYITEFAPANIRGRMVAFYQLAITVGILLAYLSNAFLLSVSLNSETTNLVSSWFSEKEIWRMMFLMMAIPSLLFITMMILVPESPRWLITKRKGPKALAILKAMHSEDIALQEYKAIEISMKSGVKESKRSVFSKPIRFPLFIGITLAVFQQFCGINAIIYYGPKIFTAAGLDGADALQAQVILGVVNVVFTVVAITQSDKLGRKGLLILGLTGMILSLLVVGTCFYTGNTNGPLLLIMLLIFIACFALSVGPITWILINEIFPNDVRVKAVSICTFALWSAVWVVGQFFPWLLETVGPAWVFWIFAGFSTINLFFCSKVLLETKGKTLEEIEGIYIPVH